MSNFAPLSDSIARRSTDRHQHQRQEIFIPLNKIIKTFISLKEIILTTGFAPPNNYSPFIFELFAQQHDVIYTKTIS
jgi:hypothetical protein